MITKLQQKKERIIRKAKRDGLDISKFIEKQTIETITNASNLVNKIRHETQFSPIPKDTTIFILDSKFESLYPLTEIKEKMIYLFYEKEGIKFKVLSSVEVKIRDLLNVFNIIK